MQGARFGIHVFEDVDGGKTAFDFWDGSCNSS
jgi:hypothetical protein